MVNMGFDFSNVTKVHELLTYQSPYELKKSRKYLLDDQYICNPALTFNFAQNTFTSTLASINQRYLNESCLKTNDEQFAKKVVDRWFAKVPQPKLNFEHFYTVMENKMQKKLKDFVRTKQYNSFKDITDDEFGNICSWFVKEQFKFDAKPGIKGPQGIIAWSKTKNLIYLSMMKYVEYYFRQNEEYIFMPALYPPQDFKLYIQSKYVPNNANTATDASGYDRTQNGTSLHCERLFFERIFEPVIQKLYMKYFKNRASYKVIGEFVDLIIEFIKASGEPGTIGQNSKWKKLSMNYIFDVEYDQPGVILIQGDDDLINKPHKLNEANYKEMLRFVDLSLKIETPKIPEFAGKIIYSGGFIPDIARTAFRVFCKNNTEYFRDKFDQPINNQFFTQFERDNLSLNSKDTYLHALQVSAKDLCDQVTTNEIEILNAFYEPTYNLTNMGTIAYEYINYFSQYKINKILG